MVEDFTTFTEVDPGSHISKTPTEITHIGYTDEDAYIYKDYGAGFWGDFEFNFEVTWVGSTSGTDFVALSFCALSNVLNDRMAYGLDIDGVAGAHRRLTFTQLQGASVLSIPMNLVLVLREQQNISP